MSRGFGTLGQNPTLGPGAGGLGDSVTGRVISQPTKLSISFWYYKKSTGSSAWLFDHGFITGTSGIAVDCFSNNTGMRFLQGCGLPSPGNQSYTFNDNGLGVWQHALITYDTINYPPLMQGPNVWVNGIPSFAGNNGSFGNVGGLANASVIVGIRSSNGGSQWDGMIAHVAYYNDMLSGADAINLASGISPLLVRPDALISYIPLDGINNPESDLILGNAIVNKTLRGISEPPAMGIVEAIPYIFSPTLNAATAIAAAIAVYQQANHAAITANEVIAITASVYQSPDFGAIAVSEVIAATIAAAQKANAAVISATEVIAASITAKQAADYASVSMSVTVAASIIAAQKADYGALSVSQIVAATISAYQKSNAASISESEIIAAIIAAYQGSDAGSITADEIIDMSIAAAQTGDYAFITDLPPFIQQVCRAIIENHATLIAKISVKKSVTATMTNQLADKADITRFP